MKTQMKRIATILLCLCAMACSSEEADLKAQPAASGGRTLIVYYSFTNNVRTIVGELAKQINADVLEVQPAEEGLDYAANNYAIGSRLIAAIRQHPEDPASYPSIKPSNIDVSQYDNIIVATPLWWSQMAAPMQSYLFKNGAKMAGKRIGLIVSSASSGISSTVTDAKRLIPEGLFLEPNLWIRASQVGQASTMLAEWIEETGLNKDDQTSDMKIKVSDGENIVIFQLNSTSAARSLFNMLPIEVEVENYSNNEKIFYPTPALQYGNDCIEGDCPAGTIALFSPWGNVVMYYAPASRYSGLYILGHAIEDAHLIKNLSGTIRVEPVTTTDASLTPATADRQDIYSIDGSRRITAKANGLKGLKKGLYISNGKKIAVR